MTIAEHRKLDAEKRREGFTEEELTDRKRKGWRRSAKKSYYAKKATGLRRTKWQMPDGSYVDLWVPVTAGESAVWQACMEYWDGKRHLEILNPDWIERISTVESAETE